MRHLRANLTLLLCLTVPTGGWWSVMHDALCTPSVETSMHDDADDSGHRVSLADHATGHSHHHAGDDGDEKADGSHACPSPMGAMASAGYWAYTPPPITVAFASIVAPHPVAAHSSFPLRPPISAS